jgi:RNA polymerase sigma factor (sigma-70 family)
MWNLSDEALLAGLAAGDPDAAATLVSRFQRRIFGLAITIVGDASLAEDIAQETFLRVWKHASTFDVRRGALDTWILTIARNLSIDALRLQHAEPVDVARILEMQARVFSDEPDPHESADIGENVARVKRALSELSPEQRRALVLAAFLGLTAREISESESIPLGTAKTRIRSALIKVRDSLGLGDKTK